MYFKSIVICQQLQKTQFIFFQYALTGFFQQPQWTVTQRWSSRCTWKHSDPTTDECGELPKEGEFVVIQENQVVILDTDTPILEMLLIIGNIETYERTYIAG